MAPKKSNKRKEPEAPVAGDTDSLIKIIDHEEQFEPYLFFPYGDTFKDRLYPSGQYLPCFCWKIQG